MLFTRKSLFADNSFIHFLCRWMRSGSAGGRDGFSSRWGQYGATAASGGPQPSRIPRARLVPQKKFVKEILEHLGLVTTSPGSRDRRLPLQPKTAPGRTLIGSFPCTLVLSFGPHDGQRQNVAILWPDRSVFRRPVPPVLQDRATR